MPCFDFFGPKLLDRNSSMPSLVGFKYDTDGKGKVPDLRFLAVQLGLTSVWGSSDAGLKKYMM